MDDDRTRAQWQRTVVELDLVLINTCNVPEPNDALDSAQQLKFPPAKGRCLGHSGDYVAIDTEHHASGFEAQEHLVSCSGVDGGCHRVRCQAERHDWIWLDNGSVEHPRITRTDPHDAIGRHAIG